MEWECIECEKSYYDGIDGDGSERMCNSCLNGLDKDDDKFQINWKAISKRRDEIVKRDNLYSKKIKLITSWYKPGDRHNE